MSKEALVIVDVQNDFCPGGSLAVKNGDKVAGPLNKMIAYARSHEIPVIATRDWHPGKTTHFNKFGGLWPEHCVQGTFGAQFHPGLALPENVIVFSKGVGEKEDAYSGFEAKDENGLGLEEFLNSRGLERILVGGLATDYCILQTVLDAKKRGFDVIVLEDAIRAVNIKKGDGRKALLAMRRAEARVASSVEVINSA